jgi:hypothetical protein
MKSQILSHSLLFVLCIFFFYACSSEKKTKTTATLSLSTEEVKIQKKKKKIFLSPKKELLTEGEVTLEVAYPQFKSSDTSKNNIALNDMIKALIDTTLMRFETQAQGIGANADEKTDTIMVKPDEIPMYKDNAAAAGRSLFISYKIHRQTPEYIELELGFSEFTGGVHGMSYTATCHYDVVNNKELLISNLFTPQSDFVNKISKIATDELMAKKEELGADSTMIFSGAGASEVNFKNFLTTNDTLSLLFDPYAVAPYAAGPQVVKIPMNKLSDIIDKNSAMLKPN